MTMFKFFQFQQDFNQNENTDFHPVLHLYRVLTHILWASAEIKLAEVKILIDVNLS